MRDFKHTMDLLVSAYFKGTLRHGDCTACAVGNIVAEVAPIGYMISENDGINNSSWKSLFYTVNGKQGFDLGGMFATDLIISNAKNVCLSTGYSIKELARIEKAFECAEFGETTDDRMFNGLMAVLEVLAKIHQVDLDGKKVFENQLVEIHATR